MLRKIRSLVSNSEDYFGIYDNALSKKECEILINQFEKSDKVKPGLTTTGYHPEAKSCRQITGNFKDNSIIDTIIKPSLISCLDSYKSRYLSLKYSFWWRYYDGYSFQKYDGEEDGYKLWHTEHGPGKEASQRIIAWMFYLNNAKSGTEFMHYPTINAKIGRCVIWPSSWTHVHKGVIPNKGLKYIITGWAAFKKNEE